VSRRHTRELRNRLAWGGSAETVAPR